jgi:amino acid adenylation domain-containing protein
MRNKDYSENMVIAAGRHSKERDYWLKKFTGNLVISSFSCNYKKRSTTVSAGEPGPRMERVKFGFPGELAAQIMKLSAGVDHTLHLILVTVVVALLHRRTGNHDIILGVPIYKQEIDAEFINTVLALRNRVYPHITFKELLLQVKQTLLEANDNQNYPIQTLLYKLNLPVGGENFPLFDTAVMLENIHEKEYLRHIHHNMTFSFTRVDRDIHGEVEYNSFVYNRSPVRQVARHFIRFLEAALADINGQVAHFDLLSAAEKYQLLVDFNGTEVDVSQEQAVHRWVEKQAARVPRAIAVIGPGTGPRDSSTSSLSYRELNKNANRLARVLRRHGTGEDKPVAILLERSPEMTVSILATWKAGGAYIPVDIQYPTPRIMAILTDSAANILIAQSHHIDDELEKNYPGKIITPGNRYGQINENNSLNPDAAVNMAALAYVIYTSGSTGKPKGAMVEHTGMMNHIRAKVDDLHLSGHSVVAQNASQAFDISVWQFFAALITGGKTAIYPGAVILEPGEFISRLTAQGVTVLEVVPSYLSVMFDALESPGTLTADISLPLEYLLVTGEELPPGLVERWFEKFPGIRLVNAYGPTETSDDITHYIMEGTPRRGPIPIGRPLRNFSLYIVDNHMNLCPIGLEGEICTAGIGVGRGYVNEVEKTAAVFGTDPFGKNKNIRLYKTGDLGSWDENGTILFRGRRDHQVKIRGFRIESGEIESQLMKYPGVKEAVVMDREDEGGGRYLCAYLVWKETGREVDLKNYLLEHLPDYMVPVHFIHLERIPLTPNGKVDRKALPVPQPGLVNTYAPPGTEVEKKLAALWAEVLGIETSTIGTDDDFFRRGGHSLNAILLVSRIHKELQVKIQLTDLFETPNIRELAKYIRQKKTDIYTGVQQAEKKEYYPLSSAQKRLYVLHRVDKTDLSYNVFSTGEVQGVLNINRLKTVFEQLIGRHESLLTSFEILDGEPVQRIHDSAEFEIEYYDTHEKHETFHPVTGEKFSRPFDLSKAPLLRVGIIKQRENSHVIMVDMHHIVSDGLSEMLLIQEFYSFYQEEQLPPLKLQYKDFAVWQNNRRQKGTLEAQEKFWLKQFRDHIPLLNLPAGLNDSMEETGGAADDPVIFTLESELTHRLKQMANENDATLFMILLAACTILLSKYSGREDIVVGTPITGRSHPDLEYIIGMFVNMLAIRNHPRRHKEFKHFLEEVKENALTAYENQDYPFDELVIKLGIHGDGSRNPLFNVVFVQNLEVNPHTLKNTGGMETLKITSHPSEPVSAGFDLIMEATEIHESIHMRMVYSHRLFKKPFVEEMGKNFLEILRQIMENETITLENIHLSHDFTAMKFNHPQETDGDFGF